MDAESIREYCLKKKSTTESFPFGNDTLVFKVKGKIFLLLSLNQMPVSFNAKCDPDQAIELREQYESIQPGYHMNKKLWNTVTVGADITNKLIKEMIDNSYLLIVRSLPKKIQEEFL
ncbi:MAG: MmcQ/YjbR family DNA-binding protein [Chitinophagaceae bacterium]